MSKELVVSHDSGATVYATIRVPTNGNAGKWWDTVAEAVAAFAVGDWANYAITLSELGSSGLYEGDIPAGLSTELSLEVIYWEQAGASPASSDYKICGSLFRDPRRWAADSALRL